MYLMLCTYLPSCGAEGPCPAQPSFKNQKKYGINHSKMHPALVSQWCTKRFLPFFRYNCLRNLWFREPWSQGPQSKSPGTCKLPAPPRLWARLALPSQESSGSWQINTFCFREAEQGFAVANPNPINGSRNLWPPVGSYPFSLFSLLTLLFLLVSSLFSLVCSLVSLLPALSPEPRRAKSPAQPSRLKRE
jgi:hypothetical protein